MSFSITNHCLDQAKFIPSPNCDQRPVDANIDLLVIHNISLPPAQYGGDYIQQFFCNHLDCSRHPYFEQLIDMQVSSHLVIYRNGAIIQFVPFNQRAWHAGKSNYLGREACNDFAIGIELEGTDTEPYEEVQYDALIGITQALLTTYPTLSVETITGHSDIAPGRKTDPGPAFDWQKYRQKLAG